MKTIELPQPWEWKCNTKSWDWKSSPNLLPEHQMWLCNLMRFPTWSKSLPLLFWLCALMMELIRNVIENHCWVLWSLVPNNALRKSWGCGGGRGRWGPCRLFCNNALAPQRQYCGICLHKFLEIIKLNIHSRNNKGHGTAIVLTAWFLPEINFLFPNKCWNKLSQSALSTTSEMIPLRQNRAVMSPCFSF